jgi:hypothetical protein
MKSRFLILMMGLLMVLAMGADAYAQATFQVSAGATQGRMNGHTEEAGGITLAVTSGTIGTGEGDNGTVLIDYGVPITNAIGAATVDNSIAVEICGEPREVADSADVDVEGNTITVTVADDTDCTANESINVEGVRLSLVGSGLDNITASVTATGDVRLLGGANTVTVMNSIVDELDDDGIDVAETLTLIRHTGDPEDETQFKLLIMENTVRSFMGGQINLEFSGIPDDVEVTIDAWAATAENLEDEDFVVDQTTNFDPNLDATPAEVADLMNAQLAINKADNLVAVITAEDNKASVLTGALMRVDNTETTQDESDHTGGMLTSGVDVIIVLGSIDFGSEDDLDALLPLDLAIQVTADVGPIGVAKPKGDQSTSIPRFASDKTTAVTVIESTSAQVTMEVAYVLFDGPYDTGIAVSNMTDDQAGAVHFALYMNGEEMKYSTPSMMQPQTTMSVLLSEVLRMAGHTGRFGGYMIITADFTKADAGVFVSDFAGFTAGATVRMNN